MNDIEDLDDKVREEKAATLRGELEELTKLVERQLYYLDHAHCDGHDVTLAELENTLDRTATALDLYAPKASPSRSVPVL